jgi:hypothetical protein
MMYGNSSCKGEQSEKEDIYGRGHQRDIGIQICLSVALGLGAFLTFCVRSSQSWTLTTCTNTSKVYPTTMERAFRGTQETKWASDRAP